MSYLSAGLVSLGVADYREFLKSKGIGVESAPADDVNFDVDGVDADVDASDYIADGVIDREDDVSDTADGMVGTWIKTSADIDTHRQYGCVLRTKLHELIPKTRKPLFEEQLRVGGKRASAIFRVMPIQLALSSVYSIR